MFTFLTAYKWCFRDRLLLAIWLDAASSSCIQLKSRAPGSEIQAQSAKGEERGDRERNPWLAKMRWMILFNSHIISFNFAIRGDYSFLIFQINKIKVSNPEHDWRINRICAVKHQLDLILLITATTWGNMGRIP